MNCPFCRIQIPEGADFCPGCGANLNQQPMNNNTPNEPKKGEKKGLLIVIAVVIVALIGFGVYYFMNKDDKQIVNEQNNNEVNTETEKDNNNENNNQEINIDPNTNTTYDENGAFLFSIEDVFTITGRGTVVTGLVLRGKINVNDEVQVIGLNHEVINTTVTAIEMFRETKDYATVGDNAGLFLKDVSREEVERGQVVIKPNSMGLYTKFKADIYVLTKEEGGRHTPFFSNYRPQFYFRTIDVIGTIKLPDNMEMVSPGETVKGITVELEKNMAMEVGTEFSIREDGRTVGKGTVTSIN